MKNFIYAVFIGFAALFAGCQNSLISEEEKVEFILPDSNESELSMLSRWKICVCSADYEKEYYLGAGEKSVLVEVNRNEPVCFTAAPLTYLKDGSEVSFFKPAGAVYPYGSEGDFYSGKLKCPLTWESGFTAYVMQKIIKSKKETGIGTEELKSFLMQFNWKKMQDKINQNIADSILDFKNHDSEVNLKFYNPWQIDLFTLLDNLSFAIFEAKYLNTTYIFSVEKEIAQIPSEAECLSSFIPENQIIKNYKVLALKKKIPQSFLIDNTYAVTLSASSAKKVSAEFTYMPILIDDYEYSD